MKRNVGRKEKKRRSICMCPVQGRKPDLVENLLCIMFELSDFEEVLVVFIQILLSLLSYRIDILSSILFTDCIWCKLPGHIQDFERGFHVGL